MKNPVLEQLITKLSDAEREQAWEEIERTVAPVRRAERL